MSDIPLSRRERTVARYRAVIAEAQKAGELDLVMRRLMLDDLFFLLIYGLGGLSFANNDWVFDRCMEFGQARDGYLDLWSRAHYKSTIITLAGVVQEILRDPEITIGIFSFNRPIAKAFLRSIKLQFEQNDK